MALVHGDGQYAAGILPGLLAPLIAGEADAVFGSRMMTPRRCAPGGMPLYKYVGNKLLTRFQNALLGTDLTEFTPATGSTLSTRSNRCPSSATPTISISTRRSSSSSCSPGCVLKNSPSRTYYGDEVCRVDGFKYAWDVCKTMLRARVHQADLLYDRKFDVGTPGRSYELKLD